MDDILDDVIKQHQANRENGKVGNAESGDEDIIDVLLRLQESGNFQVPITTRNIKALLLDIFNAGTDNSSVIVQWAMSELMRQPNLMAKAQDEVRQICEGKRTIEKADMEKLKYLKMVIHETLRLHPPTPIIPRLSMENLVASGYTIPDNTQIIVNAWAIGRDPEYWDDAENFKPERFDHKSIDYFGSQHGYFLFGLGRRMCPGITFGLANMELPLAHLLYHFDWKLPDGMEPADLDMEESERLTVQRKNNLFLIATPYGPSSDR
nr:premnaspirodiene oxygenase-like [Coffea arabica]